MDNPKDWSSLVDPNTGRMYWYHTRTRETTWSKPACLEDNKTNDVIVVVEDNNNTTEENTKDSAHSLDSGLTHNVIDRMETPQQFLQRVLLDDEKVLDTFDIKYPTEMLPVYKIVQLLIVTLGLYAFVLLYRKIKRYFYQKRWFD